MKARPTEAEFEELKRKRDEAIEAVIAAMCKELGVERKDVTVHVSHAGDCYCACPDGPCQHVWNGPEYSERGLSSTTCSRCGAVCAYHDMRVMP